MSTHTPLGFSIPALPRLATTDTEQIITQRPIQRILAFLGRSIDDVCNDPITKNQVFGFFKLHNEIKRRAEIYELERQWNPASLST